jgi:hypothetical protein
MKPRKEPAEDVFTAKVGVLAYCNSLANQLGCTIITSVIEKDL